MRQWKLQFDFVILLEINALARESQYISFTVDMKYLSFVLAAIVCSRYVMAEVRIISTTIFLEEIEVEEFDLKI